MRSRFTATLIVLIAATLPLRAHVTVWPREYAPGASERYTVRVPTEGMVATSAVRLEVPPDVAVTSVMAMPGVVAEVTRDGARITAITWKFEVPPGQFAEFVFLARNPPQGDEIVWKAHQSFADGTQTDWTGPPSKGPASVTKLTKTVSP
jgi:uncharacterized protein YcnI